MWDEIIKKASKKMIVAIVAMFLLTSADPGYIAGVAIIAIACQWSLDMRYGKDPVKLQDSEAEIPTGEPSPK